MTQVATFSIDYLQILNEQGELQGKLPEFASPQVLIDLYKMMVQLRAYDTKAIALQRTGKMGTYASTLGQEAISTAIGHAMRPEDVLVPFYRDYGAQLQRGVKMSEIYNYWGGDERGSCFQNNKEDLPISVPIASQCLHAAGVATAFKIRNQPRVAVVSCGDGGTSEGDFYEAMNVSGVWDLPVVFIVNNNQWAISVPLSKQTKAQTIAQKAIAAGFEGVQVDGNDVIAVHDAMNRALDKARKGGGPTLIEALSYRLCDHTTADDAGRYRSKEELESAWRKEPIERLQKYLFSTGAWDEQKEKELQAECSQRVDVAVQEYAEQGVQSIDTIFDYHYAHWPEALIEQKREAQEEMRDA